MTCASALTALAAPADAHLSSADEMKGAAGRLVAGQTLEVGDALLSPDGHYRLVMQPDGNLVEYVGSRALWNTHTSTHPGATVTMQSDGNFVLYGPDHVALWSTKTAAHPGAYFDIRNDANLTVSGTGKKTLWATRVADSQIDGGQGLDVGWFVQSPDRHYRLIMQTDGNFVLYNRRGMVAVWNTHTAGHPGSTVDMQTDGNLVVYNPDQVAIWDSRTFHHPGTVLQVEDTGRVVLYGPGHVELWASASSKHDYVIKDRDDIAEVKSVAHQMAADRGWGAPSELSCIDQIFDHESGWRWDADNPYSSAYGIPQATPGSKMASEGADWHENPVTQIKWGYSYIAERYGTPCGAWSFWQTHHWYSVGE